MKHITSDASQAFMRKVIMPLAGLVVGLMICAVAGVLWIAHYQTDIAIAQQVRLAEGALRIHAEKLGVSASDYGYWDEAVAAIAETPDQIWLSSNIGAGAEKSLGIEMAFALDPGGKAVYSRVNGVDGAVDPARLFPHGFSEAFSAWKRLPPDATYSGVIPYGDSAAIIAISPVRAWEDKSRPPTGYSLFVQQLDKPMLAELSRDYELSGLRLTHAGTVVADRRATFSIADAGGHAVSLLTWNPNRPGDELLKVALPFLALFMTALTVLGAFVIRHAIASAQIISDREKKAFCDPLTNLANRALFFSDVDRAIRDIGPGDFVSVMYIDLDGFKAVNDSMGHGAGDILLQQVATRLKRAVDENDSVARLGGDEFAILLADAVDVDAVKAAARRILLDLAVPYQLPAGPTYISCSIGIAEGTDARESATDLIERADSALYLAKASGKNRLVVHGEHGSINLAVA